MKQRADDAMNRLGKQTWPREEPGVKQGVWGVVLRVNDVPSVRELSCFDVRKRGGGLMCGPLYAPTLCLKFHPHPTLKIAPSSADWVSRRRTIWTCCWRITTTSSLAGPRGRVLYDRSSSRKGGVFRGGSNVLRNGDMLRG